MIRSIVFQIAFVVGTAFLAASAYIASFFLPAKSISKWLRVWGNYGQWLVRIILNGRIEIRGQDNLPTDQPYLIAAKHQSELDVLITCALFPNLTTVALITLEKTPFFGRIIRKVGRSFYTPKARSWRWALKIDIAAEYGMFTTH